MAEKAELIMRVDDVEYPLTAPRRIKQEDIDQALGLERGSHKAMVEAHDKAVEQFSKSRD